jgi:ABC-type nitrate/sulfonate/bicarbonate transport system substrate-binding protein
MTDLTITLEGSLKPHHAPLLFAQRAGIFDGRDLDVSFEEPNSRSSEFDELLEGDADVTITRPLSLVNEFLQGTEVVGIARFFHTNSGVMYRTDRDLNHPGNLGKDSDVLCSGMRPETAFSILTAMAEKDRSSSNTEISLESTDDDPVVTFYEGEHDILLTAGVNPEGVQMEQSNFEVDFWFYDEYDVPANGDLVLATSRELADGEPKQLQDLVHSLHDAVSLLEKETDRGRKIIREHYDRCLDIPGGEALLHTSLSELTSNFSQDFQTYTAWGNFLTKHGETGGFVDVDRLIDERFIPLDSMAF